MGCPVLGVHTHVPGAQCPRSPGLVTGQRSGLAPDPQLLHAKPTWSLFMVPLYSQAFGVI